VSFDHWKGNSNCARPHAKREALLRCSPGKQDRALYRAHRKKFRADLASDADEHATAALASARSCFNCRSAIHCALIAHAPTDRHFSACEKSLFPKCAEIFRNPPSTRAMLHRSNCARIEFAGST
jgi:hypothetical protein